MPPVIVTFIKPEKRTKILGGVFFSICVEAIEASPKPNPTPLGPEAFNEHYLYPVHAAPFHNSYIRRESSYA